MLLSAVNDLMYAPPHQDDADRMGPIEWRAYCRGYDKALAVAFAVMELAERRYKTARRTRRDAARAAKTA